MIRDPSDGSVREHRQEPLKSNDVSPKKASFDTGLPTGSQKPKNIARLEASRAWLKDYHARKAGA
jgi:hypothetical protein